MNLLRTRALASPFLCLVLAAAARAAVVDDAWKAFEDKDFKRALELARPEAAKGEKNAEYLLGKAYESGLGADKDMSAALEWYRKAAAQGVGGAERQLGWAYLSGNGVEKDQAQAVEWFQKSAQTGNEAGMYALGYCYKHGQGVPQDEASAAEWFGRAADKGYGPAETNLAWAYKDGRGVAKDPKRAADLFRKAADKGDDDAMNGLGWMYKDGAGVVRDYKHAQDWFLKSVVANDNPQAMYGLGELYFLGLGVDKDEKKALDWYRKSAEKGNRGAQYHVARAYRDGAAGYPRDLSQAFAWFEKAAAQGDRKSQNLLGVMYFTGNGAPKDERKAFELYLKSAKQNLPEAQDNLGWLYEHGIGTDKDVKEGIDWYRRAAQQGYKSAQKHLARLHQPVPKVVAAPREEEPAGAITREEMLAMMEEVAKKAAAAQAPAPKAFTSDVDRPTYSAATDPNGFALVVGVETYAGLPAAEFAERDARAVRDHLLALGYPERNVILLTGAQATRTGIEKYLESWLPRNVTPDSKVFFYFSGHGAPDPDTKQAYLVPWDGDAKFLDTTGYPLKRLYEKLNALKAKQVLVAMDSCFSGAGGRSVLAKGARPLVSKVDEGGGSVGALTVLAAAGPDEITGVAEGQGHGLFTYYLLKGLNDLKGKAAAKAIYDLLKPQVQDAARRDNRDQSPQLMGSAEAGARAF
jgi:TPR repeat protein